MYFISDVTFAIQNSTNILRNKSKKSVKSVIALLPNTGMIRGKLKEKFGKSETSDATKVGETGDATDIGEVPTPEEEAEENENETLSIKIVNMFRNEFITRGLEGSVSLTRYGLLLGHNWNVDVAKGEEQDLNPTLTLQESILSERAVKTILQRPMRRMFIMLENKSKRWSNVPFSSSTTVAVSCTIPIGFSSLYFEISASVSSLLERVQSGKIN